MPLPDSVVAPLFHNVFIIQMFENQECMPLNSIPEYFFFARRKRKLSTSTRTFNIKTSRNLCFICWFILELLYKTQSKLTKSHTVFMTFKSTSTKSFTRIENLQLQNQLWSQKLGAKKKKKTSTMCSLNQKEIIVNTLKCAHIGILLKFANTFFLPHKNQYKFS